MKMLVTCLSTAWGGLEMVTLTTMLQLKKRNIDVEFLCYPDSRSCQEANKNGIKTAQFYFTKLPTPKETFRLAKFLRKEKFDLIHTAMSKELWLIVPALKIAMLNTPLILSKHMGSYITKKDFLHKWIYNRITTALAISSVIKKNLLETTPLTEEKILLLYNGIDTRAFDPTKVDGKKVRDEFKINDNELLIGMIARFSPGKGHEEFLKAAKILLTKFAHIKFMVVGEPSKGEDKYAAEIRSLAVKLGVTEKIIFTGFRKDTPEILAALDLFIFPSHAEAFGITLVEAMSMGKASICSDSDGVLDIAIDGTTSFLFKNRDADDLAEKIELLINSPEKRKEFGNSARLRAETFFDLEVFTDKLIGIYKEITK